MNRRRQIDDNDLHALLDGALEAERASAVAAEIAADPTLANRFAGFQSDKAMMKALYGPVAEQPIPDHWLAMTVATKPKPKISWRMAAAIAAVLVLGLGADIASRQMRNAVPGEIVADALALRQDPAAGPLPLSSPSDATRYAGVLSEMVAAHVKIPDLRKMGYQLAAVRLYPGQPGKGAAELRYRDSSGRVFTLYLRHSDGNARFDQFERAGLRVCIWQDDQLGMVMAGDVSTAAMQRLASLTYTSLTL